MVQVFSEEKLAVSLIQEQLGMELWKMGRGNAVISMSGETETNRSRVSDNSTLRVAYLKSRAAS